MKTVIAIAGALIFVFVGLNNQAKNHKLHTIYIKTPDIKTKLPWEDVVTIYSTRLKNKYNLKYTTAREFTPWILEAAARQKLEPDLISSIILTESSFRKNATSYVGAIGPMQIMPHFWGNFCGETNLKDARQNVLCGAQILAHLRDICGDNICALKAYNIGLNGERVEAGQRYVAKVLKEFKKLRNLEKT